MEEKCLHGVPETMLQTLYARAKETQTGRGYLEDAKAVEMVRAMDYDFSDADRDRTMRTGVVARTILLDRMTREFLTRHPGTQVLNIACGLDTRCYRMEGLYEKWYNLDLPESMEIRRRFLKETEKVRQLAFSALDQGWLQALESRQGPVLIIMEGLTMYLKEAEVQRLFQLLDQKFPKARVLVEVMNPWVCVHVKEKSIEGSSAKFSWGIRNGRDLEKMVPGFRFLEEHSLTEGMQVFLPVYRLLGKIGFIRNISNKILVMEK